jgi:hypothetical protein
MAARFLRQVPNTLLKAQHHAQRVSAALFGCIGYAGRRSSARLEKTAFELQFISGPSITHAAQVRAHQRKSASSAVARE